MTSRWRQLLEGAGSVVALLQQRDVTARIATERKVKMSCAYNRRGALRYSNISDQEQCPGGSTPTFGSRRWQYLSKNCYSISINPVSIFLTIGNAEYERRWH